MKLVSIDIGNTKIKVGVFNTEIASSIFANFNTFDDFNKNIANINIPLNCHFAISSVVPDLTDLMIKKIKKNYESNTFIVTSDNCGITLNVEKPESVGTDRLCNMASAIELYSGPSIIIDFGTANTFDVIDSNDVFQGGIIAPGIETSAQYLIQKAALLDKTELKFPKQVIGKNTKTNIQSGIMFGAVDQIKGMINRIKEETQINNYNIILTGGFGKLLSSKLDINHTLEEHLTLKGILRIYKNNY